ncbi:MAG: ABC transporter permease [Endozoicomonas sp.]
MKSLQRIIAIVLQEFLQLYRDRTNIGLIVSVPLVLTLLFGYAIRTDVSHLPISVVDSSNSLSSQAIVEAFSETQLVRVVRRDSTPEQAVPALVRGEIRAALLIPLDLEQRMMDGSIPAQWLIDGSDTRVSSAILKLQQVPPDIRPGSGEALSLFETTLFYNPGSCPAISILPGLIVTILTMTMILFSSTLLTRDLEQGLMAVMLATPAAPAELLIGKMLPLTVTGLLQMLIVLAIGHLAFAVPVNGSLTQILFATLLFLTATLPLGVILSALVENQLQVAQLVALIVLPSIMLSGFAFPYEAMPLPAQWFSEFLPATHYRRLLLGLVSRGADLGLLIKDTVWLVILTLGGWCLAVRLIRKNLHIP